jgi:hypothetical protein
MPSPQTSASPQTCWYPRPTIFCASVPSLPLRRAPFIHFPATCGRPPGVNFKQDDVAQAHILALLKHE